MNQTIKITALTPGELATLLSRASRQTISEQDVRDIAEAGGILHANGTINLIEYTAYLLQEVAVGEN
jgi:hypothetical protein